MRTVSVLMLVLLSACQHTPLPYEGRVWLIDAEEDLLSARARVDEAQADLLRAQHHERQVSARLVSLENPVSQQETTGELAYRKSFTDAFDIALQFAEANVRCAEMRWAAAQAEALVRFRPAQGDATKAEALQQAGNECQQQLLLQKSHLVYADNVRAEAKAVYEQLLNQLATQLPLTHPRPYVDVGPEVRPKAAAPSNDSGED
jgi:hypothetical protein